MMYKEEKGRFPGCEVDGDALCKMRIPNQARTHSGRMHLLAHQHYSLQHDRRDHDQILTFLES